MGVLYPRPGASAPDDPEAADCALAGTAVAVGRRPQAVAAGNQPPTGDPTPEAEAVLAREGLLEEASGHRDPADAALAAVPLARLETAATLAASRPRALHAEGHRRRLGDGVGDAGTERASLLPCDSNALLRRAEPVRLDAEACERHRARIEHVGAEGAQARTSRIAEVA